MRMGRKNLYVSEEDEGAIDRLEKVLERRDQSLSDFFMQAVKGEIQKPAAGRVEAPKMSIPVGVTCALAVAADWRHSEAVTALVGPPDKPGAQKASKSSLIFAKVLGADDPVGLWIELNTDQRRRPDLPVLQLVIPWKFVFGVCVDPRDRPSKSYGFSASITDPPDDSGGVIEITTAAGPSTHAEKKG